MKTTRMRTSLNESGQAIFEFMFSICILILTLTGAGWIFHLEWVKSKCAILTFEETHARAHDTRPAIQSQNNPFAPTDPPEQNQQSGFRIQISDGADETQGDGNCGTSQEHVAVAKIQ